MRVLGYIKCQVLPELFKLIKYLSNSGSKNALFELFLARAKNELNVASSSINFPLASVLKSSVTWKSLFSVSFADNVTDILLFGFKPVFRYEIFKKWIIDFVDCHIGSSDLDRYVVPKTVWILGPVCCTDFCLNLKLVQTRKWFGTWFVFRFRTGRFFVGPVHANNWKSGPDQKSSYVRPVWILVGISEGFMVRSSMIQHFGNHDWAKQQRFLTRFWFSTLKISGPNSEPRVKKYPDRESDRIRSRTDIRTIDRTK